MNSRKHAMRMPAWNEKYIARFKAREGLFKRRGLEPAPAEALADRLAVRDYEGDDRGVCIECSHWQQGSWKTGNTCFKQQPFLLTILQRCDSFTFQKP